MQTAGSAQYPLGDMLTVERLTGTLPVTFHPPAGDRAWQQLNPGKASCTYDIDITDTILAETVDAADER